MGIEIRLPVFGGVRGLSRFFATVEHLCSSFIAVGTATIILFLLCAWIRSDIENGGVDDEAVEEIHVLVENLFNALIRNDQEELTRLNVREVIEQDTRVATTFTNIMAIGRRVDQFIENHGHAPRVRDITDLFEIFDALLIDTQGLDCNDGWGNPLHYEFDSTSDSISYTIVSFGADSQPDVERSYVLAEPTQDIVWSNGNFMQISYIYWWRTRYSVFRIQNIEVSGAGAIATVLLLHGDQSFEQDVILRLEDGIWGVGRLSAIRSRGSIYQINGQARHTVEEFLEAYRSVDLDLLGQLVTDERVLQAMWQASSPSFLSSPEEIEGQREMLGTLEWEIEEITRNEDWGDIAIARVETQNRGRALIIELALRHEERWKIAGFSLISGTMTVTQPEELDRPIDVAGNIIPPQYNCRAPQPYPERARFERRQGQVRIGVVITEEGILETMEVLFEDPPGYGFGEVAMQYLSQCEWTPAILDGRPIHSKYTFIFLFQLPR